MNHALVGSGPAPMAILNPADDRGRPRRGRSTTGPTPDLRVAITNLTVNHLQLVARADLPIDSLEDWAARRYPLRIPGRSGGHGGPAGVRPGVGAGRASRRPRCGAGAASWSRPTTTSNWRCIGRGGWTPSGSSWGSRRRPSRRPTPSDRSKRCRCLAASSSPSSGAAGLPPSCPRAPTGSSIAPSLQSRWAPRWASTPGCRRRHVRDHRRHLRPCRAGPGDPRGGQPVRGGGRLPQSRRPLHLGSERLLPSAGATIASPALVGSSRPLSASPIAARLTT